MSLGGHVLVGERYELSSSVELLQIHHGTEFSDVADVTNKNKTMDMIKPMLIARAGCNAVSCGQKIFVWKGDSINTRRGECYDVDKNIWTRVANLPSKTFIDQICAISDDIILAVPYANKSPSVSSNKWSEVHWKFPFKYCLGIGTNNPRGFTTFVGFRVHYRRQKWWTPWYLPTELIFYHLIASRTASTRGCHTMRLILLRYCKMYQVADNLADKFR